MITVGADVHALRERALRQQPFQPLLRGLAPRPVHGPQGGRQRLVRTLVVPRRTSAATFLRALCDLLSGCARSCRVS